MILRIGLKVIPTNLIIPGKYAFILEDLANQYESNRKPCDTMRLGSLNIFELLNILITNIKYFSANKVKASLFSRFSFFSRVNRGR